MRIKSFKPFCAVLLLSMIMQAAHCAEISGWKILNFDIDKSVSAQKMITPLIDERIDLQRSEKTIRLWAGAKGIKILRSAVAEMREKYPSDKWLTFVGSGDLHMVTATLIESLPKSAQPLTVILFDNHPDWFKAPEPYHCGAWVVQALKHPWVERVIMVGQNSSDLRGDQFLFAPFKELCNGRVQIYPLLRQSNFVPFKWPANVAGVESSHRSLFGTELHFNTLRKLGVEVVGDRLAKQLAGKNVYLTIDKDVLDEKDALTDWDQGQLALTEMLSIISKVSESANLVGVDVCGERAPQAVRGILKSIDCGREFKRKISNFDCANEVNQQTNLSIVNAIQQRANVSKRVSGSIESKVPSAPKHK